MPSRVFVLNGNPKNESFCGALAHAYAQGASSRAAVRQMSLSQMDYDANLPFGYDQSHTLEPSLIDLQQSILWAEHVVIVAPIWWGTVPAKLKGVFDRAFLPGFAFRYASGQLWPEQLLGTRSARLILTMDTPPWYYRWRQGAPAVKMLDLCTLRFCGFKKPRVSYYGSVIKSNEKQRNHWLALARGMGAQAV